MSSEAARDLFGDPVEPPARLSAGRRLTARQRQLAERGVNPLTGLQGPAGRTCGECAHRLLQRHHDKSFAKCEVGPQSRGPATDVRAFWPACPKFALTPQSE